MTAKNGSDETLYFVGKFIPGEMIIVSYAGPTVEKVLRLKTLMNFFHGLQAKLKAILEKKKDKASAGPTTTSNYVPGMYKV